MLLRFIDFVAGIQTEISIQSITILTRHQISLFIEVSIYYLKSPCSTFQYLNSSINSRAAAAALRCVFIAFNIALIALSMLLSHVYQVVDSPSIQPFPYLSQSSRNSLSKIFPADLDPLNASRIRGSIPLSSQYSPYFLMPTYRNHHRMPFFVALATFY